VYTEQTERRRSGFASMRSSMTTESGCEVSDFCKNECRYAYELP